MKPVGWLHMAPLLKSLRNDPRYAALLKKLNRPEVFSPARQRIANDRGRSHQQSQSPFLREIEFRADAAHSRRVSQTSDILKAVVAGKVREIAIAREVGDSVLYHSLLGVTGPRAQCVDHRNQSIVQFLSGCRSEWN